MPTDDDADDDGAGFGPPLPPDDRLWRHPSELTAWGPGAPAGPVGPTLATGERPAVWPIAVLAGLMGAVLCGGVLAVTGSLTPEAGRPVVEKVALTPIVSTPSLPGPEGIAAVADRLGPAVVHLVITADDGTTPASGVIIRDDGLLFTSAHEVVGAQSITVELADGRRLDGRLVGADLPTDVAVVSIDAEDLDVAVMGTAADLELGAPTLALGWPTGGGELAVTTGVVSALDRRLDVDGQSLHGLIQTDAPIESAWSGGPLVDANGAVIGITTDLAGGRAGFGFATPIDLVRRVATQLIESGRVAHGWLGIEGADLPMAEAERMGLSGGAMVRQVAAGSPAERSGLRPADVITEVGDRPVASSSALVVAMRHHQPGDEVVVGYWRDGRHAEMTVTIDEHP